MSAEHFKVTTFNFDRERHVIWDGLSPLPLDKETLWAIERTPVGMHIRYLGGEPQKVQSSAREKVDPKDIEQSNIITVSRKGELPLKLRIQKLDNVPPVYLSGGTDRDYKGGVRQLVAYAGIGRSLFESVTMHSAYVAYARGRPVFTIYLRGDGYHIKPLLKGVRLKYKGERSALGEVGNSWIVPEDRIRNATVIRGSRWWKFNFIQSEVLLQDIIDVVSIEKQQYRSLYQALGVLFLLLLIGAAIVWKMPRKDKTPPEQKEETVVRFVEPKKPEVIPNPEKTPEPVIVKKVIKEEPKKPEPKKPEPKKPEPVKTPVPMPTQKPKPETTKTKPNKIETPKKKPVEVEKHKTSMPDTKKHIAASDAMRPDPKKAAQAVVDQSVKELKDALGGALSLTDSTNAPVEPVHSKSSSIFSKGGIQMGSTSIKPGYAPKSASIGTIGGDLSNEVNYSKGARALVDNQKASFVAVETGGMKVEEGLTKEEVGEVIHRHMDEVRYCHESAMLYIPNIEGKVIISFTIGANGKIEKASIQSSSLPKEDRLLADCVLKKLTTWQFPHPKGGIRVSVSYPFVFKTLER